MTKQGAAVRKPTKGDWLALHQAAIAYKQLAPWRWMADIELFAVENPADRQVGYCSPLGSGGEEFGLVVFLGAEGFDWCRRLMLGEIEGENFEGWAAVPVLSTAFVNRLDLEERDRDVIRSLDLSFRGRNAWPVFRSHRPGYFPWYVEREEAQFLTAILQQAVEVAARVREGGLDVSRGARAGLVLTRYYYEGHWLEEWRKPLALKPEAGTPELPDEAVLQRLRKVAGKPRGSWELDFFLLPTPVRSGSQRPFYPSFMLAVERKQGLIAGSGVLGPCPSIADKQGALLQVLEAAGQLPREIRVARDEVRRIVEPLARAVGASVRVARLPVLEEARNSLAQHLTMRV